VEATKEIINSYSNRKQDLNSYSNRSIAIGQLNKQEEDKVLETLISMGVVDKQYRLFFIKPLRRLGAAQMLAYADQAVKYGKSPQRYFTSLCSR